MSFQTVSGLNGQAVPKSADSLTGELCKACLVECESEHKGLNSIRVHSRDTTCEIIV